MENVDLDMIEPLWCFNCGISFLTTVESTKLSILSHRNSHSSTRSLWQIHQPLGQNQLTIRTVHSTKAWDVRFINWRGLALLESQTRLFVWYQPSSVFLQLFHVFLRHIELSIEKKRCLPGWIRWSASFIKEQSPSGLINRPKLFWTASLLRWLPKSGRSKSDWWKSSELISQCQYCLLIPLKIFGSNDQFPSIIETKSAFGHSSLPTLTESLRFCMVVNE